MTNRKERGKEVVLTKEAVNEALDFLLLTKLSEEDHARSERGFSARLAYS